ncbi:PfkB family carbohydrate kinase [Nocardioides sp. Root151]|uniref:PfkB family carbohydrate kinase n=1 Tax=Nocardioides sp. Root151 TaxID=1736475 RepID=UPI000702D1E0|nr:PfkB family carbohydrate kinase [Nocardioides sp. Root151]KQZ75359.1 ribokinase [Nocardioides sp. Root151]
MDNVALVVGESLVDVVHAADGSVTAFPGGSAANVAVALSRLERPTLLATSWADDEHGRLLADHLAANGVGLASDPLQLARTSTAVATIGPGGGASYDFDIEWRMAQPTDLAPVVVHLCSLGAVLSPGADDVRDLVARMRTGATVSFDLNLRPEVSGRGDEVRRRAEHLVGLSDVVKASDEDLKGLFPLRSAPESAAALLALGPAAVVLTRGSAGATCFTAEATVEVAALETEVVDTIGAGDTFSAAVVDALWARDLLGAPARARLRALDPAGWQEVLTHGAAAAAVTVSRAGADPPYRRELER